MRARTDIVRLFRLFGAPVEGPSQGAIFLRIPRNEDDYGQRKDSREADPSAPACRHAQTGDRIHTAYLKELCQRGFPHRRRKEISLCRCEVLRRKLGVPSHLSG